MAALLAAMFFAKASPAAEPSDAHYRIDSPIVTFDLWKYFKEANIQDSRERANVIYLVTSLQGIVNREKPRLFVFAALSLFDEESRWRYLPPDPKRMARELDQFWFKQFLAKGYFKESQVEKIGSPEDLVAHFRDDVKGWCLWTMNVPATANVAMMAAGADGLLPVGVDFDKGKLYGRLQAAFPAMKTGLDLTQTFTGKGTVVLGGISFPSTGSAKNDAYEYAIRAYEAPAKLDPKFMWYDLDASAFGPLRQFYDIGTYQKYGDRNEIQQDGMYNADYWISKRAFIFDLTPWSDEAPQDDPGQPVGSDCKTYNDILETSYHQRHGEFGVCGGFLPWWIKYTNFTGGKHEPVLSEWQFIKLQTSYNMVDDSDAAFGISNASFYQHLPKLSAQECAITYPPPQKFQKGFSYICVFMMDYDGSSWANQMAFSIYDDPARGKYPLNWSINPILEERIPHAMRYLYENRTPQDFFGVAANGAGYLYLPMLEADQRMGRIHEDGVKTYIQFATAINKRFGVQYTGLYLSVAPVAQGMPWLKTAAAVNPKGFGTNGYGIGVDKIDGTPIVSLVDYHVSAMQRFRDEIGAIFARSRAADSPTVFQACRCIVCTPTQIANVFDEMKKTYSDAKVKIVDVATFFDLKSQFLKTEARGPSTPAAKP